MSKTANFKTNMTASATSSKSLSRKDVIAGVLENDHEDDLSSFEEHVEGIEGFFPSNIPTSFPDPVDRGTFVDYKNSASKDDTVGVFFISPCVYFE